MLLQKGIGRITPSSDLDLAFYYLSILARAGTLIIMCLPSIRCLRCENQAYTVFILTHSDTEVKLCLVRL